MATTTVLEAIHDPEMVGDMSRVTLNFDLSKIPFVHSSQALGLYSRQKLNMYI